MRGVPQSIKVGAVDYTIHVEDTTDGEYGECISHTQRIRLARNQTAQGVGDTLLHEVLHAIWYESGLFDMKRIDEERIVRTTATWLKMVFRDNPHAAAFIVHPEEHWPFTAEQNESTSVKS